MVALNSDSEIFVVGNMKNDHIINSEQSIPGWSVALTLRNGYTMGLAVGEMTAASGINNVVLTKCELCQFYRSDHP